MQTKLTVINVVAVDVLLNVFVYKSHKKCAATLNTCTADKYKQRMKLEAVNIKSSYLLSLSLKMLLLSSD